MNDYDFADNKNEDNIKETIAAAERIASMSFEYEGTVYHPEVEVIGFEGGHTDADIFGIPQESFNAYIKDYNDKLAEAVKASSILKKTADKYTTVPLIAGKVTFNEDGLHYSDASLEKLLDHIAAGK